MCTFDHGEAKFAKKVAAFGGTFIGLPCALSEKEVLEKATRKNVVPFRIQQDLMQYELLVALRAFKPEVVVADFMALAALEVSGELDVPLVINLPGPMKMMKELLGVRDLSRPTSFLGVMTATTPLSGPSIAETLHLADLHKCGPIVRKATMRALVCVNSFFGLEPPDLMPPSAVMTGPLSTAGAGAATPESLATTHPQLHAFLEGASQVAYAHSSIA